VAVRIRVDGVAAVIRRHELRRAHRAGVRSLEAQGIDPQVLRQQQKLLEFIAKEFRPGGIVECQGGERIEHPVRARQAPIVSFDPEYGRQIFRRHAAANAGLVEGFAVSDPELRAFADAPFGEKNGAIFEPGLGFFGGPVHGVDDGGLALSRFQQLAQ
jgi:hypothetical protein